MANIQVNLKKEIDDSYDILIEKGIFERIPEDLKRNPAGSNYALITDLNVKTLYGKKMVDDLKDEGLTVHLIDFPVGEASKNLNTIEYVVRELANSGFNRESAVIALGGGVVGDVAGFVASTYMRGIPHLQVPTTLMAQVDSSIGGKTAVNLREGKNLIGSFHQPKRVYVDPTLLTTLHERDLKNGIAEIIKYGMIYDKELFEYLEKNVETINQRDMDKLTHIILRSCQIKSEIVKQDEKEENFRSILNYGHTLGHAEELCGNYKTHLHGEAVAIGMNFSGHLALRRGLLKSTDLKRQNNLIESFNLPQKSEFIPEELLKVMYHDKKNVENTIMFVLPEKIGKMTDVNGKYRIPIPEEEILVLLRKLAF